MRNLIITNWCKRMEKNQYFSLRWYLDFNKLDTSKQSGRSDPGERACDRLLLLHPLSFSRQCSSRWGPLFSLSIDYSTNRSSPELRRTRYVSVTSVFSFLRLLYAEIFLDFAYFFLWEWQRTERPRDCRYKLCQYESFIQIVCVKKYILCVRISK